MITGLRPQTFEHLQLNSGAFLKNFNYSTHETVQALKTAITEELAKVGDTVVGATIGDGTFQCTPTIRNIEANGMRYPIKGSTVIDMWTVKLTGTMKEIRPETFKDALISADIQNSGANKKVIRIRTGIKDTDYIKSLCWVGETSKGMMLIDLENALNLTGANFTFVDKGEGSLPFEFQAHKSDLDMEYAPVSIVFLENQD